jgi:polysaccharide biosynthesis protein PslH
MCAEVCYATAPQIASFAQVIDILDLDQFDIIWVERTRLASLVTGYEGKTIVDLDDIMYKKTWREATAQTNPLHALAMMPRVLKHWTREVAIARRYLAVVVCSDEDNQHLRTYGLRNVHTIPNGVDIGRRPVRADGRNKSLRIAFVGNMRYPPNHDAIVFFSEEILPVLRGSVPGARLDVVSEHVVQG